MWVRWTADLISILSVIVLWNVLLPGSRDGRFTLFGGRLSIGRRETELSVSFFILAFAGGIALYFGWDLQPRLLLVFAGVTAVMALCFRGLPLSFTVLHALFALAVTEYLKLLFRCFVPSEWEDLLEVLLVNGSTFGCVLLLQWIIRKHGLVTQYYEHRQLCWVLIAILGVPVLILSQFLQNTGRENLGRLPGMFMLLHFLMLCLFGGTLLAFRAIHESQKIAANERYIHAMEDYVDSARTRAHDYRKHLNYLHDLVMTQDNMEKLRQEVQSYYKDLSVENQLNDILLQIEHPLFRALLYGQYETARRERINLRVYATPQLPDFPLPEYKLVEVFQNLMDNAMDAVRKQEPERRWVGVHLESVLDGRQRKQSMIIENPIPGDMPSIAKMTEKNFTTKQEQGHQGLGLYQVSKVLEKSGGELLLEDQDGVFRVEVSFVQEVPGSGEPNSVSGR